MGAPVLVGVVEHGLDELADADVELLVDDPGARPPDASAADHELLHGRGELVRRDAEDVGVDPVVEHDGGLGEGGLERADVIAVPCGRLVVHLRRGVLHALRELAHVLRVVARHEAHEVVRDLAVLLVGDAADARGGAAADVAEQARAVRLAGALERALGTGPHREHLQQVVYRLADGPDLGVGTEVLGAADLAVARDHDPWVVLAERHGQVGVRLVVPELDVERRVELLDPRELELQRLELAADDGPLDAGRRRDHPTRALVQALQGCEVVGEPGAEVVRLAHVEHAVRGVAEAVHARRRGDLPRSRAVADGVGAGHQPAARSSRARWDATAEASASASRTSLRKPPV